MSDRPNDEPPPHVPPYERLTVAQAAAELRISEGAVRSRIKRGTITTERDGGTVYVVLGDGTAAENHPPYSDEPSGEPRDHHGAGAERRLLESYEARIESLERALAAERDANRENRRLLAAALERIPELEAAERSGPGEHHAAEHHEASEDSPHGPAAPDPAPEPRPTVWGRLRAIWRGTR